MIAAATFLAPLLEATPAELSFEYLYEEGVAIGVHSKTLALRNVTALPLTVALKAKSPFAIDRSELHLPPGASATLEVSWEPGYRRDRQCDLADAKLVLTYREHPQRDSVRLVGDAQFPNVAFDLPSNRVEFGAVLNDTGKKVTATMTNTSRVDVVYTWFHDEAPEAERERESLNIGESTARSQVSRTGGDRVGTPTKPPGEAELVKRAPSRAGSVAGSAVSRRSAAQPIVQSAELFDVLPLRGVLKPGQSEKLEFAYAGNLDKRARCGVVCVIEGGPEYPLTLAAESAVVKFNIERTELDCGIVPIDKVVEQEVVLHNPGKVPLLWAVCKGALSRPSLMTCVPEGGRVAAGATVKIAILYLPATPGKISETFHVQINHLEPTPILIVADASYPRVSTTLPRLESESSRAWLREAIADYTEVNGERAPAAVMQMAGFSPSGSHLLSESQLDPKSMLGQSMQQFGGGGRVFTATTQLLRPSTMDGGGYDGRSVARTSKTNAAKAHEKEVVAGIEAEAERRGLRSAILNLFDEAEAAATSPDMARGASPSSRPSPRSQGRGAHSARWSRSCRRLSQTSSKPTWLHAPTSATSGM